MSQLHLEFEEDGKLARIKLANGKRRNAIVLAMWQQLPDLLNLAQSARALVISGEGEHFSAGADIHEMGALRGQPKDAAKFRETMSRALAHLRQFPAPAIAHIKGSCFGAGVALALACDLRYAAPSARFSIPPAKLGLIYPQADIEQLVRLIGPANAKQLLFGGEVISASQAAGIGLINAVEDASITAKRIFGILQNSAQSIKLLKSQVDGQLSVPDAAFDACFDGDDFAEGLIAFADKRRPDFS